MICQLCETLFVGQAASFFLPRSMDGVAVVRCRNSPPNYGCFLVVVVVVVTLTRRHHQARGHRTGSSHSGEEAG